MSLQYFGEILRKYNNGQRISLTAIRGLRRALRERDEQARGLERLLLLPPERRVRKLILSQVKVV